MLIMQTSDAAARRSYIESTGLSKVIWRHDHDGVVCAQYHPKGVKGTNSLIWCISEVKNRILTSIFRRHDA